MTTASWVAQELLDPDLGDARLNARLITVVQQFAAQPTASIPQACGSWAAAKAAYRFIASKKVTPQKVRDAQYWPLLRRLPPRERVLAIQDTTEINFTTQPCMQGIGPTNSKNGQGLFVHSLLMASPQGVPEGMLWQKTWARDPQKTGQSKDWRKRDVDDKESIKWLQTLEKLEEALPETRPVVLIGDCEADMYPLFAHTRRAHTDLLVRAAYNRRIREEAHTLEHALALVPVAGAKTLSLAAHKGQPAREAVLEVRFARVTLVPPDYYKGKYAPVALTIIEAREVQAPEGVEPLHWKLLTSLRVEDFDMACTCLQWYAYRWLIEQYHFVLKSGCQIEALQLESVSRFEVALALYCLVAWRLLWLTYLARSQPDLPCESALETAQWQALYCTVKQTTVLPSQVPTLHQVVRWVAQLGGFLGRKGDGEPGVKTIWRGLQRLNDISAAWELAHREITYG
jgi:hypothetical protein